MEYKDQSIKDLKLNLTQDYFNHDVLPQLKKGVLIVNNDDINVIIEAAVIGASHSINIFDSNANESFTEVLANIDLHKEYSDLDVEMYEDLGYVKRVNKSLSKTSKYKFEAKIIDLEDENESSLLNLLQKKIRSSVGKKLEIGLDFTFPDKEECCYYHGWKPMTLIHVEIVKNTILISTAHIYSSDNRALYSQSAISFNPESKPNDLIFVSTAKVADTLKTEYSFNNQQIESVLSVLRDSNYIGDFDPTKDINNLKDIFNKNITDAKKEIKKFEAKINSNDMKEAVSDISDGISSFFNVFSGKK